MKGEVTFDHVNFGYAPDKTIIHDFSASVKPGQKVAIVGPTGAGKTTIVNLLMRFYELNKGKISVDGVSLADLTRENVHSMFGMVLQDTWLFEATSSVDTRTELRIQKAMNALTHGRTSYVIAHRLSTIRDADLILYMQDGDIKETGTHDELMAQGGMYAELYNSQFALAF